MRFIHVSDTHLGYSAYRALCNDPGPYKGLNLREVDTYQAFANFVEQAIAEQPDLILHTGDLFDSIRPSNRTLGFAMEQFLKLSRAGIPLVVIAGNHSMPRIRETGSVFRLFDHLDNIHCVYRGAYEQIKIGDMTIHALPYGEGDYYLSQLESITPADSRYNVMMLHTGVASLKAFQNASGNEQVIEDSYLQKNMDYVALGHFHGYQKIFDNAYYSGSTERFSFSEARQDKGYLTIDLDKNTKEFTALPLRKMIDLPYIDALRMDAETLTKEMEALIPPDIEGAIVRMTVNRVLNSVRNSIDIKKIKELCAAAAHFELRLITSSDKMSVQSTSAVFGPIEDEFISFVNERPMENVNKQHLKELGLKYLKEEGGQSD